MNDDGQFQYVPVSLRDWFAGQALVGLLAAECIEGEEKDSFEKTANMAYRQADAMLAERAKNQEGR